MPPVLEFRGLTKEYRNFLRRRSFRALNSFSLAVQPGEIFGFLGPNGAGKTTAIHIALGLMKPSSGSGDILGRSFGDAPTRRRIGFLAENVAFYHRSAETLIRFYGVLNGVRDPILTQRTKELLKLVELEDVTRKSISKFSRGMLQRVGLAQALINDPELLILDEPTSALDTAGRVMVRELLFQAKAAGKTIFLSSHMLSEIELICDRVGILHHGELVRIGTVAELLESSEQFEITARHVNAGTTEFPALFHGQKIGEEMVKFVVSAGQQRSIIERIWAAGGEVMSVSPVKRSLEEIFLALTSDEKRGDVPRGQDAYQNKASEPAPCSGEAAP